MPRLPREAVRAILDAANEFHDADPTLSELVFGVLGIPFEISRPDGVAWCPFCYWYSAIEGPIRITFEEVNREVVTRYYLCTSCEQDLNEYYLFGRVGLAIFECSPLP